MTQTVASPSSSDCKDICNPGHYQTGTRCDPCGVGFYQSQSGMFYCDPCPVGQTTRGTTSTSASECYNDCNPGYELSSNGVCVQCAIGTYRILGTPAVCVACPSDKTTAAKGSTKATDCSLTSCLQGYRRDGVPGTCVRCEKGTYQDEKWQTACKSCGGVRYMTMNDASTQKSDCIFFCESGQEVDNSTGTLTCVNCPVGTYKDNTVDPTSKCISCPGGKLMPTTASDSVNDCSIFRCGAGYRPNATGNGCDPCPYGTYQPLADQENCTMCGSGYSTYQMASNQPTDCKVYCDSGKVRNEQSQTCEVCLVGYYKTNTDYKFNNCTRCPENYITPNTGSDDVANCTVLLKRSTENSVDSETVDSETYYIIGLSCMGIFIIVIVTIVLIFVRRHLKLEKEIHSLHYVKRMRISTQQQIGANDDDLYQELEENHYHYLTPTYRNSHTPTYRNSHL